MKVIDADKLWLDIMMLPHNGDMISSAEVEGALKEADSFDPEKSPWIPVAERLPEHYRNEDGTLIPFIVCVRNCKNPVVAYYNGEIWGDMGRMDVVAWAPTPEPYKEERND